MKQSLNPAVVRVLKRLHYPLDVILMGNVAIRRSAMMCGITRTTESSMKTLNPVVARVLKRLHYPLDVILTCVRWYVAYPLSLRHLEDMMAERGVSVDHSTVHRWAIKLFAGIGESVSPPQTAGWQELADGRDVHPHQGRMAVSLPGRRQGRQHH